MELVRLGIRLKTHKENTKGCIRNGKGVGML